MLLRAKMRTLKRIALILLVVIVVVVVGAGGFGLYTLRRMLPTYSGTVSVPGLTAPVTILRDADGVPHLYAQNAADLFFAQGFVHAQDRWWQMEFQRHIGQGRIGELTGKVDSVLETDMFIRTVGWNRSAQADLAALPPDTRNVLEAYSAGVNAYIANRTGPDLAIEYSLLAVTGVNIKVEPYRPLDILGWTKALGWQLSSNFEAELRFARLLRKYGDSERAALLDTFQPPFPEGRPTILADEDLPVLPQAPTPKASAPATFDWRTLVTDVIGQNPFPFSGASNSWVVSGARSQTGSALLANDPHLGIQMPSLFYPIGLHCQPVSAACPYDRVVGFGIPGAPGVLIGRNSRIAWGLTTPETDVQDLYVLNIDPADSSQYLVDGQRERISYLNEVIRFGDGSPDMNLTVQLTRWGPIITALDSYQGQFERPMALRWAANEQPYDLVGALLAINRAQNWEDFRLALTDWAIPSQNFVYADVEGNIGYQLPGRVPIRAAGHDGQTPIDGATTRYDWRGLLPFELMPRSYNPPRGYIVTANQRIAPDAYAAALQSRFGDDSNYFTNFTADVGYRAARIEALLKATPKHTLDTFKAIQADVYSGHAAEMLPKVLALPLGDALPQPVLDWLRAWDYTQSAESGQAALYEAFVYHLTQRLFADDLGETPRRMAALLQSMSRLIDMPDSRWWDDASTPDQRESRDQIVQAALKAAYDELVGKLGTDYQKWQWGKLHTATFVSNPLGLSGIGPIEAYVNAGPFAVNGGTTTINRTATNTDAPYAAGNLSALRFVVDMGQPDSAQGIHTTGQSGHPASELYRNMIERWRTMGYTALPITESTIRAAAVHTLTLTPGR
jgi:penicillin amidase